MEGVKEAGAIAFENTEAVEEKIFSFSLELYSEKFITLHLFLNQLIILLLNYLESLNDNFLA